MKKFIKIFIGFIVVFLIALIVLPIIFQDKIIALVKEKIDENVNAKVELSGADLSLIRNFPNASVKIFDITVINRPPFEGDTLFYSKEVILKMGILDVIKGDEINIKSFALNNSKVNILVNKQGEANYDIAKKPEEEKVKGEDADESTKKIDIESYEINHLDLVYNDQQGKMLMKLLDFNHSGSGDLSADRTELDTKTSTGVFFKMDKSTLVNNIHLDLSAIFDLDLKNQKYSFLKNEAHINKLPLLFEGFVKLNEKNQEVDLKFHTPSSDFKNFLALVPQEYAKNTESVNTTGNFEIKGKVNGIVDDKHIPKIDVNIASNNASFKFPDLPKGVNNIQINTSIKNTTGILDDTYVDIKNIAFKIDNHKFKFKSLIKRLTTNPLIDATLKGKLDLADINKVYPLEKDKKLSGLINADLTTNFDLEAIQKSIPSRIKNNGKISLNDFEFSSKEMVNSLVIKNAEVDFKPTLISLTNFDAKTGSTDIKAKGTIDDLLGFLLSDKNLKGNFELSSNQFKVTDFMQESAEAPKKEEKPTETNTGELKIPAFLDITTKVNAKKVLYDNLELTNVTGAMIVKDQKAILKDIKANMFDGTISLNGNVDTQQKTPSFDLKMGIKGFNIASSFKDIDMLKKLAPIADFIEGKLNTEIDVNGKLTKDFTPDLNTIGGNALAQLLDQSLNPENSKAMSLLGSKLKFIDLKKLNLKDIKTKLSFKDGKVNVDPFKIKYKDIDINIGGSHGFDQSMNYNLSLDVPAKYLGQQATGLLSKLDSSNKDMKIPLTASITGSFTNPSVKTDMKTAVKNLTNQLIAQQKTKLKNKAVDEIKKGISKNVKNKDLGDALEGVIGDKEKTKQKVKKTVKKEAKKKIKNVLGGFLGGK